MCEHFPDSPYNNQHLLPSPLTAEKASSIEERLGFTLPLSLRALYIEVGNGGFGPGYGLYPLDDDGGAPTAITEYAICTRLDVEDYPGWNWPVGLLPICDWGCAVYSYVYCSNPAGPVYRFDYDGYDADDPSTYFSDMTSHLFSEESPTFQLWIEWWLDGTMRF